MALAEQGFEGQDQRLDPRSVAVERIGYSIFFAVILFASFIGVAIISWRADLPTQVKLLIWAAWIALAMFLAVLAVVWPRLVFRRTTYSVSPQAIRICRGVLWRTVSSVPRSRVQHTDVSQGPVERAFELSTLVIYTAGTEFASISLSGLSRERALAIRDHLIDSGQGDAV